MRAFMTPRAGEACSLTCGTEADHELSPFVRFGLDLMSPQKEREETAEERYQRVIVHHLLEHAVVREMWHAVCQHNAMTEH